MSGRWFSPLLPLSLNYGLKVFRHGFGGNVSCVWFQQKSEFNRRGNESNLGQGFVVFIPPKVPVDVVLVFVFIVKIGKGDVVAALALLVGPVVFSGVVTGISLVWRISGFAGRVWATGVINPLVIPERYNHVIGTGE